MNTAFLSPRDYLRHLQTEHDVASQRDLPVSTFSNPLVQMFRDQLSGYEEFNRRPTTLGEVADQLLRQRLEILADKFHGEIPNYSRDLHTIPVGAIFTNSPNALAIAVPSGGVVIVVDLSLYLLFTILTLVLLMFDVLERDPGFRQHPDLVDSMPSREVLLNTVRDIVIGFLKGKPIAPSFPVLAGNSAPMVITALRLVDAQINFVLAHELAHVASGHLDGSSTYVLNIKGSKGAHINVYRKMRSQEMEADKYGLCMSSLVAADEPSAEKAVLLSSGPELFFVNLQLIQAVGKVDVREESTHPSAPERLQQIRELSREHLGPKTTSTLDRCEAYAKIIAAQLR